MVDKATFPRDKCCGDGLTTGALRELESLGFDPSRVPSWQVTDTVWMTSPSGQRINYELPSGKGQYAAIARRVEFDNVLVEMAVEAGAELAQGCTLAEVEAHTDGVHAVVDGLGEVNAQYLVAADGMWSRSRKLLGVAAPTDSYRGEWHAFRQYFTNVGPAAARDLHVWFEPDLLPGYMWSFPLPGNRANVGFGIDRSRQSVQKMADQWPDLLSRPHIREVLGPDAVPESRHTAWPIPARVDDAVLTTTRTFFVGDAAAATDVLTGEGIAQALQTGMWSAEAILEHRSDPAAATAGYTRRVRHGLVADHRMSAGLRKILASNRGARWSIRLTGSNAWTRRNFVRWMFEDYPRAQLFTPRRWHRDMFVAPGAYQGTELATSGAATRPGKSDD